MGAKSKIKFIQRGLSSEEYKQLINLYHQYCHNGELKYVLVNVIEILNCNDLEAAREKYLKCMRRIARVRYSSLVKQNLIGICHISYIGTICDINVVENKS